METFAKLFGSLLALVYHCFDRVVIRGHLPLLTRSENIAHFFRDIRQIKTISKEVCVSALHPRFTSTFATSGRGYRSLRSV